MYNSKLINEITLSNYTVGNTMADKARGLINQQRETWSLASKNYTDLDNVERKTFNYGLFKIVLQFNPGRIISSSAKVDSNSIKERPCFLCAKNLPLDQRGLLYKDNYIILVNPFPIFLEHFTIPLIKHQPQIIESHFSDMLDLSKDLGLFYMVFYNGPNCGASAPDHMHFQACSKGAMPIEKEIQSIFMKRDNILFKDNNVAVYGIENYLRSFFIIKSENKDSVINQFNILLESMTRVIDGADEPMMNIIALYDTSWKILLFPRAKHRPSQYFLKGEDQILSSPAAVDFGGLFITPRKQDFNKISKTDIKDIFAQTSVQQNDFKRISDSYSNLIL